MIKLIAEKIMPIMLKVIATLHNLERKNKVQPKKTIFTQDESTVSKTVGINKLK